MTLTPWERGCAALCLLAVVGALVPDAGRRSPNLPPVTLPIASSGGKDHARDHRIIVTLDADGTLQVDAAPRYRRVFGCLRRDRITHGELGTVLDQGRRITNLMYLRDKGVADPGDIGIGFRISPFRVLLRADKDVAWRHARRVLGVTLEQRTCAVQWAVKRYADGHYTRAEAELLGSKRATLVASDRRGWEASFDMWLTPPPRNPRGAIGEPGPVVHVGMPAPTYRWRAQSTRDVLELGRWIRRHPTTGPLPQVDAEDGVPLKFVVAVLNQFAEAGFAELRFRVTR